MTIDCQVKGAAFDAVITALQASIEIYKAELEDCSKSLQDARHEVSSQGEDIRGRQRIITVASPESEIHDNNFATRAFKEQQVRDAENILKAFRGVPSDCVCDVVQAGALVEVQYQGSDEPNIYIIAATGTNRQFNIREGRSFQSVNPAAPVGKALLGHRAGETITVQTPGGNRTLTIEAVI